MKSQDNYFHSLRMLCNINEKSNYRDRDIYKIKLHKTRQQCHKNTGYCRCMNCVYQNIKKEGLRKNIPPFITKYSKLLSFDPLGNGDNICYINPKIKKTIHTNKKLDVVVGLCDNNIIFEILHQASNLRSADFKYIYKIKNYRYKIRSSAYPELNIDTLLSQIYIQGEVLEHDNIITCNHFPYKHFNDQKKYINGLVQTITHFNNLSDSEIFDN